jgi:AraC-like DNA-binding protein
MALNALGRQILDVLRNKLIPWSESGTPFMLLDAPPKLIGTNIITEQPGPKLPIQHGKGQNVRTQRWAEENMNTMTSPYMGCVVKGEADIVIGTTSAMCRKLKILGKRWIISAPQQNIFMVPPHIPVSSGMHPHWERPHPERAYSRILWFQFHGNGVSCHFCTSDKGEHHTHPVYFIQGTKFLPLANALIDEMTAQSPQYLPLVYHNLGVLLHLMVRGLLQAKADGTLHELETARFSENAANANVLIQHAIDFIDQNIYDQPLTLQQIANHLQLSPRHLSRIFRRETDMSVKDMVISRRMRLARQLLLESQFNIARIARQCGYASPSSFIKVFTHHFGMSPTAYRAAQQTNGPVAQQLAI